ncbi:hypothetical protein IWZ01DRAFT_513971 [Phyllosticta capitalensis]
MTTAIRILVVMGTRTALAAAPTPTPASEPRRKSTLSRSRREDSRNLDQIETSAWDFGTAGEIRQRESPWVMDVMGRWMDGCYIDIAITPQASCCKSCPPALPSFVCLSSIEILAMYVVGGRLERTNTWEILWVGSYRGEHKRPSPVSQMRRWCFLWFAEGRAGRQAGISSCCACASLVHYCSLSSSSSSSLSFDSLVFSVALSALSLVMYLYSLTRRISKS